MRYFIRLVEQPAGLETPETTVLIYPPSLIPENDGDTAFVAPSVKFIPAGCTLRRVFSPPKPGESFSHSRRAAGTIRELYAVASIGADITASTGLEAPPRRSSSSLQIIMAAASGGDNVSSPAHQRTFSTSSGVAVSPSLQCVDRARSAACIRKVEPASVIKNLPS